MDKHKEHTAEHKPEGVRDSLGQPNPAQDLEKKNLAAAQEKAEKDAKDAKEGKKPEAA